jgi:hypothetical protein
LGIEHMHQRPGVTLKAQGARQFAEQLNSMFLVPDAMTYPGSET